MTTVYVVSLHTFDWCFLRHVCATKETALKYWEEIRKECIEDNDHMIAHCKDNKYDDENDWKKRNDILRDLEPGEKPDNDDTWHCDEFPTMEEWEVE